MMAPVNLKGASRKDSLGSLAFFKPEDGDGRLNARRRVLPPVPELPLSSGKRVLSPGRCHRKAAGPAARSQPR